MTVTMKTMCEFLLIGTDVWLNVQFKLFIVIRSDQGGSRNLFSDMQMQILIHLLMLLLFLMIRSNLVHTKVQTTNPTMSSIK